MSRLRTFAVGALGTLATLALAALIYAVAITWVRASHGQMAYEFLARIQQQQVAEKK